MTDSQHPDPWRDYHRDALRSGWSYPVGQQEIRDALNRHGASVHTLGLSIGLADTTTGPVHRVVFARWSSISQPGWTRSPFDGAEDLGWLELSIGAVPTARRAGARADLVSGALDSVAAWLGAVRSRPETWKFVDHTWHALLRPEGGFEIDVT